MVFKGYKEPDILGYLNLLIEWVSAADYLSSRLRRFARRGDRWLAVHGTLQVTLVELDVVRDAAEQAAGAQEDLVAFMEARVSRDPGWFNDVRELAKEWLRSHCAYEESQRRALTVHAEAGLMGLYKAVLAPNERIRKVVEQHGVLQDIQTVRAICKVALPALTELLSDI